MEGTTAEQNPRQPGDTWTRRGWSILSVLSAKGTEAGGRRERHSPPAIGKSRAGCDTEVFLRGWTE